MKRILSVFLALTAAFAAVAAEDEIVRATGVASTYRGAVNEALVAALEQHDGITVSSTEVARATEASGAVMENKNGQMDELSKTTLNDGISKSMNKLSQGRIKSYEVLSDTTENGKCRVEVAVHFAGKYELGLPEGSRRRMAVADFRPETGDSYTWCNQSESSSHWAALLAEKLNERLTQTRKFTMLDRKFDSEVTAELARLSAANAAAQDAVRLNQKLGTDYLIVGSVRFFPVAAPSVNPLTGQTIPVVSQPFCEVSYRVLLAPTGQLKWSDSVRIDAAGIMAATIGDFAVKTADAAAMQIADGLMADILPFEIVGKNGNGEIIIGEGGKSLAVGERFTVFALGEEIVDTRTGEVLDRVETAVGDVEVTRVAQKVSFAKILGGDSGKMVVGSRLRRVVVAQEAPQAAPALPTTVQGAPNGGVVTPF